MKKGISLIVLVVTIIVMIIIAGAVIISLSDTNIIEQSKSAATSYRVAQLEENLKIEMQNALLAKYGTTENVSISIKEILNIEDDEDERIVNIATANSIPANMPAGTYYELDGNRYATKTRENEREINLASRAIDRDNEIVTNTYVVNDNLDVYYIISGTIGKEQPEIDDEKVIEIITGLFDGTITDQTVAIAKFKQELHMESIESNNVFELFYFFDENERNKDNIIYYFYPIDRIYLLAEGSSKIEYISKEENEELYKYAAKIEQIRKELETAFVGESLTAIKEKYKNGILEQYILNSCASIKEVQLENLNEGYEQYFIEDITYEYNNIDMDSFCSFNTFNFVYDENGICILVFPSDGA